MTCASPTLQQVSIKRSLEQCNSPTGFVTVEQKQDRDKVLISDLLKTFQDNDEGSITLTGTRTESESGTEVTDVWLLLELRVKDNRHKDLLDHIAGITAQLTPIYNQTEHFRVVVSLLDDNTPFYLNGPARTPADLDILEKSSVYVTGIFAHDKKLRGDFAVETLKNNFKCDTDKYLLILKHEKFESSRKDLSKKSNSAAKELTALWKKSSTTRAERGNLTAEILDEEWCPHKLANSILGCGEHLHEKALKFYIITKVMKEHHR